MAQNLPAPNPAPAKGRARKGFSFPKIRLTLKLRLPKFRFPKPRLPKFKRPSLRRVLIVTSVAIILAAVGGGGYAVWKNGLSKISIPEIVANLLKRPEEKPSAAPSAQATKGGTETKTSGDRKGATAGGAGAPEKKAVAKVTPPPAPLPPGAPEVTADYDPQIAYPFARRLAAVNKLAHKTLVTAAEYHDSDAGERYFVAVVTSCKDLLRTFPIKNGKLARVEEPLQLRSDFPTFAWVERDGQGQWGVASCDGTV